MCCAQVAEAFGANRWDTAQFADGSSKDKFIKLMVRRAALPQACSSPAIC